LNRIQPVAAYGCNSRQEAHEVAVRLDLVERAQRGDREAFDIVMLESIDRLYAIARMTAQDADVAEDAVQEALLKCWRDLPTLRALDRFEPWLHRLLMNSVTEEFRKRRRVRANVTVLRLEPSTSDATAEFADRDELQRAFGLLSIEHRVVLVLHHYLGMSTDEAAQTLGIPAGTVKSRLHYALEAMRDALDSADRVQRDREMSA
jgi:RNA polymerase sigma-70 factor (ECF subfamily)